ncbi:hypothetical protein [Rhizobium sp. 22-785-1]
MGLSMPTPIRIGPNYYLRVRVPSDLKDRLKGVTVTVPVDGRPREVRIGEFVKVSLETAKAATAKVRFVETYDFLQRYWAMQRKPVERLTHKQLVALAGALRNAFVTAFEDEPGSTSLWMKVLDMNAAARVGKVNSLAIGGESQKAAGLSKRFGPMVDAFLAHQCVQLHPEQRARLLELVVDSLDDAAMVTLRRAEGDYSPDTGAAKYPPLEVVRPKTSSPAGDQTTDELTFDSVIDTQVSNKAAGKDAAPMRDATVRKFRLAAAEFVAFRGSDLISTVTAQEADRWKRAMLADGKLSNNTVGQRIQNLKTVIQWAREQTLGAVFPDVHPLHLVTTPDAAPVASEDRTFTLDEARATLLAARQEKKPELRWLPWMCAYSGARINEVAQLRREDFFQVGDDWFFELTTKGGKSLKNRNSIRKVPVHPALIDEGLIDFVKSCPAGKRIFPPRSQPNISEWLRGEVGIKRAELAPNHGWRHLFEDRCVTGGVLDKARLYITGRTTGASDEGYGRSQALLPGLAKEMAKVPRIDLEG